MNVPDLRYVDLEAYRQRALQLRQQAMNDLIDVVTASIKTALRPRAANKTHRVATSAPCTAGSQRG